MKNITTANPTLGEWIEEMRALCTQNKHTVKIRYNNEQALASFYAKGQLVDNRKLLLGCS